MADATKCSLCSEQVVVTLLKTDKQPEQIIDSRVGHYINWHVLAADRALIRSLIDLPAGQRARILAHVTTITEA